MTRGQRRVGFWLALMCLFVPAAATAQDPATPPPAMPSCFGAAARDPLHPCHNPRLRLSVTPTPDEALITPNLACETAAVTDEIEQCSYGVPADQAVETVAVVGDSHAAHWRAALAVVAQAKHWRILEFAIPHCPFSLAAPNSGPAVAAWCPDWNQRVLAWLAAHPEVQTVFASASSLAPIMVPAGQSAFATEVFGYVAQWRLLPASVAHLIVIRDDPTDRVGTFDCVRRAIARRRPADALCDVPRRHALPSDPEAVAAEWMFARGVRVVDLTHEFCGPRVCFPVVGGVLVHKDDNHLGQLFAQTLGPFLLRDVEALIGFAPRAPREP